MKRYLKKVVYCTKDRPGEIISQQSGILYVTDSSQKLKLLKGMNLPVAVWLCEDNKDQDLSAAAYAIEDPLSLDEESFEQIYRREKQIPWDILETDRCLVREMVPEDAVYFAKMYENPEVSRYLKDYHGSIEAEAQYIKEYQQHYRFYEYGVWSVLLKETGEVIGRVGFSQMEEMDSDIPGFGYMIEPKWQGQGIAYEVSRAALDYAKQWLGMDVVQLMVDADNKKSISLAEKLGFSDNGSSCHMLRKMLHLN